MRLILLITIATAVTRCSALTSRLKSQSSVTFAESRRISRKNASIGTFVSEIDDFAPNLIGLPRKADTSKSKRYGHFSNEEISEKSAIGKDRQKLKTALSDSTTESPRKETEIDGSRRRNQTRTAGRPTDPIDEPREGGRGKKRSAEEANSEEKSEQDRESISAAIVGSFDSGRGEDEEENHEDDAEEHQDLREDERGDSCDWMEKDFEGNEHAARSTALIVRDEEIPSACGEPATTTSKSARRYFLCSGAIFDRTRVVTSASCVEFAYFYEHHLAGDVAVLLGATGPASYVIKVHRIMKHPQYTANADDPNYATHNIALLFLRCSITWSADVKPPHFPKSDADDVAHLCCADTCNMLTVVQKPTNCHVMRAMKPRYVPSPRHIEPRPKSSDRQSSNFLDDDEKLERSIRQPPNSTISLTANTTTSVANGSLTRITQTLQGILANAERSFARRSRSTQKSPEPPAVPSKPIDSRTMASDETTKDARKGGKKKKRRRKKKKKEDFMEFLKKANLLSSDGTAARRTSDGQTDSKGLAQEEAITEFKKKIVNIVMEKANRMLDMKDSPSLFKDTSQMETVDMAGLLLDTIVSETMDALNMSDASGKGSPLNTISMMNVAMPSNWYEKCPPLGTPIMKERILVGLVAYNCDDLDSRVEWKYVNIADNLEWIFTVLRRTAKKTRDDAVPLLDGPAKS